MQNNSLDTKVTVRIPRDTFNKLCDVVFKGDYSRRTTPNSQNTISNLVRGILMDYCNDLFIKIPDYSEAAENFPFLCSYCPIPTEYQGTHGTPNGYASCEGKCCAEAYDVFREWIQDASELTQPTKSYIIKRTNSEDGENEQEITGQA